MKGRRFNCWVVRPRLVCAFHALSTDCPLPLFSSPVRCHRIGAFAPGVSARVWPSGRKAPLGKTFHALLEERIILPQLAGLRSPYAPSPSRAHLPPWPPP